MSPRLKEEKVQECQEEEELSPWEEDYQLLVCEGLFSEYLEMGESCPGAAGWVGGRA